MLTAAMVMSDDDDDDGNYDDDSGGGNDDDDDDDDDTKVSTYLWFFLWRLQKLDEVLELIKFNTHHNIYAKSQREKVNASSSSTSSFISTYAQRPQQLPPNGLVLRELFLDVHVTQP